MIIIKKYFKYIGLIGICLLSFYYTEKVALYVKSNNPLIKTITNIKDSKYVSSINSTIIDNKYIILIAKTLILILIMYIIKKIGISILKKIKDNKQEYIYTRRFKLIISI